MKLRGFEVVALVVAALVVALVATAFMAVDAPAASGKRPPKECKLKGDEVACATAAASGTFDLAGPPSSHPTALIAAQAMAEVVEEDWAASYEDEFFYAVGPDPDTTCAHVGRSSLIDCRVGFLIARVGEGTPGWVARVTLRLVARGEEVRFARFVGGVEVQAWAPAPVSGRARELGSRRS